MSSAIPVLEFAPEEIYIKAEPRQADTDRHALLE